MGKLRLIVAALLVLVAPILTGTFATGRVAAQSGLTIPQWLAADGQGRFTILAAALDAAGLTETLGGGEAHTLLAPTDSAFRTFFDFLGKSQDEVFADTATLRQILLYHVLPGRVFFRQLASGQSFATALEGKSVQGGLANGFLTVEGAQVSDVDNVAMNGVIQVIDSVLIPPDVLAAAHLRAADFAPDSPGLDVYVDGGLTLMQAFGFPMVTGWIDVPAAIHNVAFTTNGGSLDKALIIPADFTFRPDSWTTLAVVGSVADKTLFPVLIKEDADPLPAGDARITVLDALENAPPLDFMLNDAVVVSRLGFPFALGDNDGTYRFNQRAGRYAAVAKNYGASAPFEAALPAAEISAGWHYFFAAAGTVDHPVLVVSADQR